MGKSDVTEGRETVEAILADQLQAARTALAELSGDLAESEKATKDLRDRVRAAKSDVERIERASKALGPPVKRGPRKPRVVPSTGTPPAATA